ncbi:MAG: hypothetical protein LBD58_07090 [Treponema sp.]|jgi:hypothetical protein|nr:hypothetical protein [Treponema sp.]
MGTTAAQSLASLPIAAASIGCFEMQAATLSAGMTVPPAFGAIVWGELVAFIVMHGYKWLKLRGSTALHRASCLQDI